MFIKRLSGGILGAAAVTGLASSVLPARAAYIVTLRQEGNDVIVTGSGTIDLTGLSLLTPEFGVAGAVYPNAGAVVIAPPIPVHLDAYSGL